MRGVPQSLAEETNLRPDDFAVSDRGSGQLVIHSVGGVFRKELRPHLSLGGDNCRYFGRRQRLDRLLFGRREKLIVSRNNAGFGKRRQIGAHCRRRCRTLGRCFLGRRLLCHGCCLSLCI